MRVEKRGYFAINYSPVFVFRKREQEGGRTDELKKVKLKLLLVVDATLVVANVDRRYLFNTVACPQLFFFLAQHYHR